MAWPALRRGLGRAPHVLLDLRLLVALRQMGLPGLGAVQPPLPLCLMVPLLCHPRQGALLQGLRLCPPQQGALLLGLWLPPVAVLLRCS